MLMCVVLLRRIAVLPRAGSEPWRHQATGVGVHVVDVGRPGGHGAADPRVAAHAQRSAGVFSFFLALSILCPSFSWPCSAGLPCLVCVPCSCFVSLFFILCPFLLSLPPLLLLCLTHCAFCLPFALCAWKRQTHRWSFTCIVSTGWTGRGRSLGPTKCSTCTSPTSRWSTTTITV